MENENENKKYEFDNKCFSSDYKMIVLYAQK